MKLSQLGEFGLIDLLKRGLPVDKTVKKGIGDDCAVVDWDKTRYMLLTTDMLLEGVHFTPNDPPRAIGHKALAVNLSDIATMGGTAKYALVSLGLPPDRSVQYVQGIYEGMRQLARRFGVSIVGGDTNRAPVVDGRISRKKNSVSIIGGRALMVINVALIGHVAKKDIVLRSGAQIGDAIFVTGPLGNSYNSRHHMKFTPRLKEVALLKKYRPHAMIDISDGLVDDLRHILIASGVGARLHESAIPRRGGCRVEQALYNGEDFELLFTVGKSDARRLLKQRDINVFCIGEITKRRDNTKMPNKKGKPISFNNDIDMINKKGQTVHLLNAGYRHF